MEILSLIIGQMIGGRLNVKLVVACLQLAVEEALVSDDALEL